MPLTATLLVISLDLLPSIPPQTISSLGCHLSMCRKMCSRRSPAMADLRLILERVLRNVHYKQQMYLPVVHYSPRAATWECCCLLMMYIGH